MSSSTRLTTLLYDLLEHHVPVAGLEAAVKRARNVEGMGSPDEHLLAIAERLGGQLEPAEADAEPEPGPKPRPLPRPEPDLPPAAERVQCIPVALPHQKRTAQAAVGLAFEVNPGRWLKFAQIDAAVGAAHSTAAVRRALQLLVLEEVVEAKGATAARVFRKRSTEQAGSAETLPPSSSSPPSSDSDESPAGEERGDQGETGGSPGAGSPPAVGSEHDGEADGGGAGAPSPGPPTPSSVASPTSGRRRPRSSAAAVRGKPLVPTRPVVEEPPPDLHVRRHRRPPSTEPSRLDLPEEMLAAVEAWVGRQQTFRKRQLIETFPEHDPDQLRRVLAHLGNEGRVTIDNSNPGEPLITVVGNEPSRDSTRPSHDGQGTPEGRLLGHIEACGGCGQGAAAAAVGMSQMEVAPLLSKMWREGTLRTQRRDGETIYVRAA